MSHSTCEHIIAPDASSIIEWYNGPQRPSRTHKVSGETLRSVVKAAKQVWLTSKKTLDAHPLSVADWDGFQSTFTQFGTAYARDLRTTLVDAGILSDSSIRSSLGLSAGPSFELDTVMLNALRYAIRYPSDKAATEPAEPEPTTPKKPLSSANVMSPRKSFAVEAEQAEREAESPRVASLTKSIALLPRLGYAVDMRFGDNTYVFIDRTLYIFSYLVDTPLFGPKTNSNDTSHQSKVAKRPAHFSFANFDAVNQTLDGKSSHQGSPTTTTRGQDAPVHARFMTSVMSTRGQEDGINLLCGIAFQVWNRIQFTFYGDVLRRWNSSFVYKPRPNIDFSIRIRGNSITNRGTLLEHGMQYRLTDANRALLASVAKRVFPDGPSASLASVLGGLESMHFCVSKGQYIFGMRLPTEALAPRCVPLANALTSVYAKLKESFTESAPSAQEKKADGNTISNCWQEWLKGGHCSVGLSFGSFTADAAASKDSGAQANYFYQLIPTRTARWSWRPRPFLSIVWD